MAAKNKSGLASGLLATLTLILLLNSTSSNSIAQANSTLTFSNLDPLQGDQHYLIYQQIGDNLTLIEEINSSDTQQHTTSLQGGNTYLILPKPGIGNVYANNPTNSGNLFRGLLPAAVSLIPYILIGILIVGLLGYALWRR